jgi:choline-sulfatase
MMRLMTAIFILLLTSPIIAADRPNILFILTDDQAPDTVGAYGNTVCQTPNIDRLAAEGMRFENAHHMGSWSGAVCRPSRTMIMTGRHVWNIPGVHGKKAKKKAAQESDPVAQNSMPAIFNRAGYATFRTCKNGNSYPAANQLFAEVHDATKRGGTAESGSAWHAEHVLEYLDKRATGKKDKPFLIYFGLSHPHDPRNGPEKLVSKYGANNRGPGKTPNAKAPPLPANWLPAHPFHHGQPNLRDEVAVQGVGKNRDEATVRNEIGRNYACIENIDSQIGRVLKKLKAIGELDNTYIFFTSDHGMSVGRHGLMGKQNLYEHTWRVPFIVRGPGIKPGSTTDAMIYLSDVLPTFCELASIEKPKSIETKSIAGLLKGDTSKGRSHVYGVYSGGTKPGMRAIKTGRYKLIKYDVLDGKVRETQLFDLEKNPQEFLKEHHAQAVKSLTGHTPKPEQVNLADDPKYAKIRKELETLLLAEMKRVGDPYRLWDQPRLTALQAEQTPKETKPAAKQTKKLKAAKRPARRSNSAMTRIKDDPKLPRVLLIGDSISIGYTLPVRKLLAGKANVHRPTTNCGPTTRGITEIDKWLGKGKWDVIHFNWGLHDLKYITPDGQRVAPPKGKMQVPIDAYEKNLRTLVTRLKKTDATLIWCSTTPVPAGAPVRIAGDSARYNEVAAKVMKDMGVETNDLFAFVKPQLTKIQKPKNVHFTPQGSKALAQQVSKTIEAALAK